MEARAQQPGVIGTRWIPITHALTKLTDLLTHSLTIYSNGSKSSAAWSRDSLATLYHYMRCSQLENLDAQSAIQVRTLFKQKKIIP